MARAAQAAIVIRVLQAIPTREDRTVTAVYLFDVGYRQAMQHGSGLRPWRPYLRRGASAVPGVR